MRKILFGLVLLFSINSCVAPTSISYNNLSIEEYEKKMKDSGYKFTARAQSYQLLDSVFTPRGGASSRSQVEANDMAMNACKKSYFDCVIVMEGSQLTYIGENAIKNKKYREEYLAKSQEEEKNRVKKLEVDRRKYLEDNFGSKCSTNKANNVEYNKCLNDQEQIAKKEKAIQEAKQAEENKKKQLIAEKQKAEEDKLNKMLANMKPEERRAYVCEKTYGLRKGSDKFSECVYKILAADVELEKIELQKKLAEAQLETAKANEAAARANAAASASRGNVSSYDPNVAAAMDRANEIERAKILLNLSQALRTPPASPQFNAPPRQQNCKLNPYNNRITCY